MPGMLMNSSLWSSTNSIWSKIKQELKKKSVLNLTKETAVNNKLNFLDVAIDGNGEMYENICL